MSLAQTPGVAEPCIEIQKDPDKTVQSKVAEAVRKAAIKSGVTR